MKLITNPIRQALLKNGALSAAGEDTAGLRPVLKLFTPWAGATWLITECDPDEETRLFGLCRARHNPNYVEPGVMLI